MFPGAVPYSVHSVFAYVSAVYTHTYIYIYIYVCMYVCHVLDDKVEK